MLQRLKDFREDKDISQKKMAEILNVAQTTYSDYELGKINIPLNTLKKLALYPNPIPVKNKIKIKRFPNRNRFY